MRVWFIGFILLFATAEFLQWLKQFSLPLPIFILGGAFLAVASNYDKLTELPFHPEHDRPEPLKESVHKEVASPEPATKVATSKTQSSKSISFTISKQHRPGD